MFLFPTMLIPADYNLPPTVHALLESIVNFDNDEKVKIYDLAKNGRSKIFDFEYPFYNSEKKEHFECMILNHYMMRRIGFETFTAFKLALNVKLNEIMPNYNKLFTALETWNIFEDGETTHRTIVDSRQITTSDSTTNTDTNTNNVTSNASSGNTSDRRFSDTPENVLTDIMDGKYVTNYNYDQDSTTSSNTTNTTQNGTQQSNSQGLNTNAGNLEENITKTPADKMRNYLDFINEEQNVYTMLFKELDVLFYQII